MRCRRLLVPMMSGLLLAIPAGAVVASTSTPAGPPARPSPPPSGDPCPVMPPGPVAGASPSPAASPAPGSVAGACGQLAQVLQHAHQADDVLSARRADLAAVQALLAQTRSRLSGLKGRVAADQARDAQARRDLEHDQALLAESLRVVYEQGSDGFAGYLLSAGSFSEVVDRSIDTERVVDDMNRYVAAVGADRQAAADALSDAQRQRDLAVTLVQQQATLEAAVTADVQVAQQADSAAHAATTAAAAQAALALARAHGTIYPAVDSPIFTPDSDLTKPSGLTAARIDRFLQGTALAGLGATYVSAESTHHVSADYLVADSILESAWGTSAIARAKNNILGVGADDSNPGGDAVTFTSFAQCILVDAQIVATNYLSPTGMYYSGPTLRGMNVHWASDPLWADRVAAIADTIP